MPNRGRFHRAASAALATLALVAAPMPAAAQTADFYRGKVVTMLVGGAVGGGYDQYARTFARHMQKHIPGEPNIVAKNVPAGGGLVAGNVLGTSAPDGLTIGAFSNNVPTEPLFGNPAVTYDSRKLNWLGSIGKLQNICATWHTSPIRTIAQAQAETIIVGGAGATSNTVIIPNVLNDLIGTKFKVIAGYDGGGGLTLSIERGEVQGICGLSWSTIKASRPRWISDRQLNVLVQVALEKLPDLPDVPSALDLVTDPTKRQTLELILIRQEVGRPFALPPGVAAERVALLRKAFEDTLVDPEFVADAQKQQLEVEPLTGAQIDALLAKAYATPPDVIKATAALLNAGEQK